ncbi:MAG: hypothetical protein AB7O37_23440 [Vicinamibacteria bacterium]
MRKTTWIALTISSVLAAGVAWAHDEGSEARDIRAERAAPGVLERGLERLERAVARLEARLAGRGGSMDGCADMMSGGGMMGGGMMGGSQPNERWRSSPSR